MGNLTVQLKLVSTDLFAQQDIDFTVTSSLTIDGDVSGLNNIEANAVAQDINVNTFAGTNKKAFIYARNKSTINDVILNNALGAEFSRIAPGETVFFITTDNDNIEVESSAGTAILEYFIGEIA